MRGPSVSNCDGRLIGGGKARDRDIETNISEHMHFASMQTIECIEGCRGHPGCKDEIGSKGCAKGHRSSVVLLTYALLHEDRGWPEKKPAYKS